MWIFTENGFISAVDNGMEPGKLAVRARDRKSLELLSELADTKIVSFRGTDYPYRVHVTREELASFLVAHVETMDYGNFKNRVYDSRGSKFAKACGKVWEAMLDVTDDEAVDARF